MRITITDAEKAEIEAALALPYPEDHTALASIVDRLLPFMAAADMEGVWHDIAAAILQHAEVESEPFKFPVQAGVLEVRSGDGTVLASKPLFVGDPLLPPKRGLGDFVPPPGMTAD
jgi:hypothetical protein